MAVFRSCLLAAAAAAVFGAPCRDGVATTSRFASTTTPGLTGDGSIPANINAFLARANDALYIRVTDFPAGPLPTLALRAWAGWNSNAAGNGGLLAARNAAISSAEATSEAGGWWEAQLANSSAVAVLSLTATADVTNATVQLLDDEREVIYTWAAPSASAGAPMYFWAAETCVDVANEFASFISRAGKRYATSEEASFRLRIFNATLDFVAKHNARGNASWSMGVNSMSDLTEEELKSRFYGLRADSNAPPSVGGRVLRAADTSSDAAAQTAARAQAAVAARRMETDAAVAAAAQAAGRAGVAPGADAAERGRNLQTTIVDWATQANVVTPARSQGSTCNSCWAFAAAGAIESAGAIAGRGLYDLSEQQLIDCTMSPVTTNMGCDGGSYVVAFQWLAAQPAGYGLCTESAYPYSTGAGQCRTCTPPFPVTGECQPRVRRGQRGTARCTRLSAASVFCHPAAPHSPASLPARPAPFNLPCRPHAPSFFPPFLPHSLTSLVLVLVLAGFVAMPSTSKDSDIQTALTARPLAVGIYSTTPFVYYSSGVYNDATCAGSTNGASCRTCGSSEVEQGYALQPLHCNSQVTSRIACLYALSLCSLLCLRYPFSLVTPFPCSQPRHAAGGHGRRCQQGRLLEGQEQLGQHVGRVRLRPHRPRHGRQLQADHERSLPYRACAAFTDSCRDAHSDTDALPWQRLADPLACLRDGHAHQDGHAQPHSVCHALPRLLLLHALPQRQPRCKHGYGGACRRCAACRHH